MARKLDMQEPLLTAVARKLGQAAGTLVNMSQMLTAEPTPESHVASTPKSTKPGKAKSSVKIRQNQSPKKRRTARAKRTAKSRNLSASNRSASKRGSARKR